MQPDEKLRKKLFSNFVTLLKKFSLTTQFVLLTHLIELCPYSSVNGILIQKLKEIIRKVYQMESTSPSFQLIFSSKLFSKLFVSLQKKPEDTLKHSDHVITYLNLLLFVFILDRKNRKIIDAPLINEISTKYLTPLSNFLKLEIQQLSNLMQSPAQQKQSLESFEEIGGLPKLSNKQLTDATLKNITDLQLVESTLSRIVEILNE